MSLRVGIIGLGAMGTDHAERIAHRIDGATLAGVADLDQELAREHGERLGARVYETGLDLVRSDDIDAVAVVTHPHETHEEFALEAIAQGKFVFVEKPLTISAAGCQRIVDAEVAAGRRLVQVGYMRRYDAGYVEIRRALQERRYGEPLLIHAAHRNKAVNDAYTTPMSVVETAIHEVDVLRWLLDEDYAAASLVLPGKQTRHTHGKLHDPQIVVLESASGVRIDLEVFVNNNLGYDIATEVVCEDGIISLQTPQATSVKVAQTQQTRIPGEFTERFRGAYESELQQWVDGVVAGRVDGPTSWDGLVAMVACDALAASRENGGARTPIELPERPALYR